jgi:hypothetical protein
VTREFQELAVAAFRAVDASGMARVDFFYDEAGRGPVVNEINTIPGFTVISMFPTLWETSGLPYPRLLDRLVELALERHRLRPRPETLSGALRGASGSLSGALRGASGSLSGALRGASGVVGAPWLEDQAFTGGRSDR